MKSLVCLFLIILLPLISVVEGGLLGAPKPIKVTDQHVVATAKFAVSEHNKQSKANLVYVKIVEGTEKVVSGIKYELIIAAKNGDGGAVKKYKAVVIEKAWENPSMTLDSFVAVY